MPACENDQMPVESGFFFSFSFFGVYLGMNEQRKYIWQISDSKKLQSIRMCHACPILCK